MDCWCCELYCPVPSFLHTITYHCCHLVSICHLSRIYKHINYRCQHLSAVLVTLHLAALVRQLMALLGHLIEKVNRLNLLFVCSTQLKCVLQLYLTFLTQALCQEFSARGVHIILECKTLFQVVLEASVLMTELLSMYCTIVGLSKISVMDSIGPEQKFIRGVGVKLTGNHCSRCKAYGSTYHIFKQSEIISMWNQNEGS